MLNAFLLQVEKRNARLLERLEVLENEHTLLQVCLYVMIPLNFDANV